MVTRTIDSAGEARETTLDVRLARLGPHIGPALQRAIACGRPACINVAVDPDAPFPTD